LMAEVFGEDAGVGARSAVGMSKTSTPSVSTAAWSKTSHVAASNASQDP
jgi:hypothetical protein